jgi:hypothetical protein
MTELKSNMAERTGTTATVCTRILMVIIFDLIHNQKISTMIAVFSLAVRQFYQEKLSGLQAQAADGYFASCKSLFDQIIHH